MMLILALVPDLDLAGSRLFCEGAGQFAANGWLSLAARNFARAVPLLLFAALFCLYLARKFGWLGYAPDGRSMVFLALTLALGPGLLIEGILKQQIHRPRPEHTRPFAGALDFEPYTRLSGGCPRNCSFPSGEAAASFWTVAPASLAPLPWRAGLTAAALLFGVATGVLRIAAGGHFLSDVLAAGLITFAVIFALRRLLWPPTRENEHDAQSKVSRRLPTGRFPGDRGG